MKSWWFAMICACSPMSALAQDRPALMPWPAHVQIKPGVMRIDPTFRVAAPRFSEPRLQDAIRRALDRIESAVRQPLSRGLAPHAGTLTVEVEGPGEAVQSLSEHEAYALEVAEHGIALRAQTTVGALRGLETLIQLIAIDGQGAYLPCVRIEDQPRFAWRGLLLDVSRHFMSVAAIKRTLDGMAAVKLNVLHWHLSDDQGFRVESLRFPKLQQLASDGQYYSQPEIRELVRFARARGIRVMPEFDVPGHSTSWLVAYPEYASAPGPYEIERRFGIFDAAFDPSQDATYRFFEAFIAELAPLFPDAYWHIGGDELTARSWQGERLQRFKRQHQLADDAALHAYFNRKLIAILAKHGKTAVGWDEILHPALDRSAVIESWSGTAQLGKAAALGHRGILSAPYYLDRCAPSESYYLADPLGQEGGVSEEQAALVLGGEASMWAEYVDETLLDSRLWPRLAAIAERFWSAASERDVDDMYRRLSRISLSLERLGLSHEVHGARMLRALTGRRRLPALQQLLEATMPIGLSERSGDSTQLTPFTHLVDAARPDPRLRVELNQLARQARSQPPAAARAARARLAELFTSWQTLPEQISLLSQSVPVAAEGLAAASALKRLAALGLGALGRLGQPPSADWKAATLAELDALRKPQGLLRIAGTEAVATLVE